MTATVSVLPSVIDSQRAQFASEAAFRMVDDALAEEPWQPHAWTTLAIVFAVLGVALVLAPVSIFNPYHAQFLFIIGAIGIWRYGWGILHFLRSLIYRKFVFPRWRRRLAALPDGGRPTEVYLLVTSFRIDAEVSRLVFGSVFAEAIRYGVPSVIVASVVENADERLVRKLFDAFNPPETVRLCIVRISGKGKRAGLAYGFRAISKFNPPAGAVTCVIDGDTLLEQGVLEKCLPLFRLWPDAAALTTDEVCDVRGSPIYREWYNLRFAQRQLLMCSMGLSRRVLTLTGRMSAFRASVTIDPGFIRQVEHDELEHWRLGRFKFLTGDDKSSWFWILKNGRRMLYVPDARVRTVEDPPSPNFLKGATALMVRWYGNMLRTNGRAIALGPRPSGWFTWLCIIDQRVTMWTSLISPIAAILIAVIVSLDFLFLYALWIGCSRLYQTMILLSVRNRVTGWYPILLYFTQIYGSIIKTYILFRLERQKWTRQKTSLRRDISLVREAADRLVASSLHLLGLSFLIVFTATAVGVLEVPGLGSLEILLGALVR